MTYSTRELGRWSGWATVDEKGLHVQTMRSDELGITRRAREFYPRNFWRLRPFLTDGTLVPGGRYEFKMNRKSVRSSYLEELGPFVFEGFRNNNVRRKDQPQAPQWPQETQRQFTPRFTSPPHDNPFHQPRYFENVVTGVAGAAAAKVEDDNARASWVMNVAHALAAIARKIEEMNSNPTVDKLLKYMNVRVKGLTANIMLVGPAGCGKSTVAQIAAERKGVAFGTDSMFAGTSPRVLIGYREPSDTGEFVYVPSTLVDLYENGGVYLADEFDAADANLLVVLHRALANGEMIVEPRKEARVVKRHTDFWFVAACNTYGSGSRVYVAREELDEATLSRFLPVSIDYDVNYEWRVASASDHGEKILDWTKKMRDVIREHKLRRTWSTRHIETWIGAMDAGIALDELAHEYFLAWSENDRNVARQAGLLR